MKKLLISAILISVLLMTSCGSGKEAPLPSPSAAPRGTASASTPAPSAAGTGGNTYNTPEDGAENKGDSAAQSDESSDEDEVTDNNSSESDTGNEDSYQSDSVSIVNSSSVPFYGVYLTTSSNGNPGENIIGDTPLGVGEEISLPFANAPTDELTIIIEDENGIKYSAGGINLKNGLVIELALNNGVLEAITR